MTPNSEPAAFEKNCFLRTLSLHQQFVCFFFINLNFENQWNHLYCFYTGPSIRSDHVLYVSVYRRLNKDYQLQEVAHDVYKKEYLS